MINCPLILLRRHFPLTQELLRCHWAIPPEEEEDVTPRPLALFCG